MAATAHNAKVMNRFELTKCLVAQLKRHFATVKHAKPPASRKDSSEWYVVAQGFKGAAG